MFYGIENFSEIGFDTTTAQTAAKVANEVIEAQGIVLYGTVLEDGSASGFSTIKAKTDTHVLIGVGISEMAAFVPEHSYVKRTRTEAVDKVRELEKQLALNKIELGQLRGNA